MTEPDRYRAYWEASGSTRTFTHPLDLGLLDREIPPEARVLDFGCGYGRLMDELDRHGYRDVHGVDFSAALIARGRQDFPHLRFTHADRLPLDFPDGSFDAVLLFAVLTCIPEDEAQRAVVAEIARLLHPGGVLYLSDLPLQTDERNQARYRAGLPRFGTHGVFETDSGGVFRHHDPAWLRGLLEEHGFETINACERPMATMEGSNVIGLQILARRA